MTERPTDKFVDEVVLQQLWIRFELPVTPDFSSRLSLRRATASQHPA